MQRRRRKATAAAHPSAAAADRGSASATAASGPATPDQRACGAASAERVAPTDAARAAMRARNASKRATASPCGDTIGTAPVCLSANTSRSTYPSAASEPAAAARRLSDASTAAADRGQEDGGTAGPQETARGSGGGAAVRFLHGLAATSSGRALALVASRSTAVTVAPDAVTTVRLKLLAACVTTPRTPASTRSKPAAARTICASRRGTARARAARLATTSTKRLARQSRRQTGSPSERVAASALTRDKCAGIQTSLLRLVRTLMSSPRTTAALRMYPASGEEATVALTVPRAVVSTTTLQSVNVRGGAGHMLSTMTTAAASAAGADRTQDGSAISASATRSPSTTVP